ncbi:glycosyltransferase [Aurantimonas sp. VKM B-3413]|uniref:rhamnosyltransferase WsaF family glycosyltransferase n=1 Tax=Aurantimonas sp. VKM B-3413 TaxID=2779401 RepID=UPI001E41A865|nr:glycosyltransferase [Aurantimonas sp. VKM B-3413]MCB8839396.1 glycosyltransferase [Aurantimonas sp. VKM B-3413]
MRRFRGSDPLAVLKAHPLLMDEAWYLQHNPDVAEAQLPAAVHFHESGWKEGRNPGPLFNTQWYLDTYEDIRAAGTNPLIHYIRTGWKEGRSPFSGFDGKAYLERHPEALDAAETAIEQHARLKAVDAVGRQEIAESGLFHEGWYRACHADLVAVSDLLGHFLDYGQREGRKPNPYFDPFYYSERYADVVNSDLPALLHYLRHGWREGRDPSAEFSLARYAALTGWTPEAGEPLAVFLKEGLPGLSVKPVDLGHPAHRIHLGSPQSATFLPGEMLRYPVDYPPAAPPPPGSFVPNRLVLHWVVPDFYPGGGGHMTIFRMVRALSLKGHRQTVWLHGARVHETGAEAFDDIVKHYRTLNAEVRWIDEPDFATVAGDAVIATDWGSVFPARAMRNVKRCFYFVQDYEPFFRPRGTESLLAESTYGLDVDCLCASPWLAQTMETQFGRWARFFHLAADRDIYAPAPTAGADPAAGTAPDGAAHSLPRIAFYARGHTARRAVELGHLALEVLASRGHCFLVDFFGTDRPVETAPFAFVDHGLMSGADLADLYREATIGVVFSATNYSLVPQEMMACGLPVVELDVESTRAIYPDGVVSRALPDPAAIADEMEALITDAERRVRQRAAALAWVGQFSWDGAAAIIETSIVDRLQELGHSPRPPAAPRVSPKISVVIPTLNGGPLLMDLLERVKSQKLADPFEILVVDSGSTDGTADRIAADPKILFHRIDAKDFGHGRTRNLGIELTSGDYVAFLTQDAMPVGERWLADYVLMLDHFPKAGGAFGPHWAWPSASAFVKRDISGHFRQFRNHPLAVSRELDPARYDAGDTIWRQMLHYYSDNNSCLRRSVWKDTPYRDVAYGEDQLFAEDIVAAGYQKVFVPSAIVYHSHDYDEAETFARAKTEGAFFSEHFGYVLIEDEAALARAIAAINASDTAWGLSHGVAETEIDRQRALNTARLNGLWAGQRAGMARRGSGRADAGETS